MKWSSCVFLLCCLLFGRKKEEKLHIAYSGFGVICARGTSPALQRSDFILLLFVLLWLHERINYVYDKEARFRFAKDGVVANHFFLNMRLFLMFFGIKGFKINLRFKELSFYFHIYQ